MNIGSGIVQRVGVAAVRIDDHRAVGPDDAGAHAAARVRGRAHSHHRQSVVRVRVRVGMVEGAAVLDHVADRGQNRVFRHVVHVRYRRRRVVRPGDRDRHRFVGRRSVGVRHPNRVGQRQGLAHSQGVERLRAGVEVPRHSVEVLLFRIAGFPAAHGKHTLQGSKRHPFRQGTAVIVPAHRKGARHHRRREGVGRVHVVGRQSAAGDQTGVRLRQGHAVRVRAHKIKLRHVVLSVDRHGHR